MVIQRDVFPGSGLKETPRSQSSSGDGPASLPPARETHSRTLPAESRHIRKRQGTEVMAGSTAPMNGGSLSGMSEAEIPERGDKTGASLRFVANGVLGSIWMRLGSTVSPLRASNTGGVVFSTGKSLNADT